MKKMLCAFVFGSMAAGIAVNACAVVPPEVIAVVQNQVAVVAASVPVQVRKAEQENQAAITELQKNTQQQIVLLQKQIQQVQDNMTKQLQAIQKEVHQLELMH